MNRVTRWGFALALLPMAACSSNPPPPPMMAAPMTAPAPMMGQMESNFVMAAANSDMTEIQTSQQALQKASRPAVKQFAQMMIDMHTGMSQRLASIAQAKGMTPPMSLDAPHQQMVDRLAAAPARGFDAAYLRGQVMGHQQAVQVFQAYAANGTDPELKAYAQQSLPEIQKHLAAARRLSGARR